MDGGSQGHPRPRRPVEQHPGPHRCGEPTGQPVRRAPDGPVRERGHGIPASIRAELPALGIENAIENLARFEAQAVEAARELFLARASQPGVTVEWRHREGNAGELVGLHARYADLAVVGQDDPRDAEPNTPRGVAERVLLESGRPVLVVPYVGARGPVGERVVVAWTRAARPRAPRMTPSPSWSAPPRSPCSASTPGAVPPGTARCPALTWRSTSRATGCARRPTRSSPRTSRPPSCCCFPRRPRGRPARHGRVRPLAPARAGAGRRDPRDPPGHDHPGLHVALTVASRPISECEHPRN